MFFDFLNYWPSHSKTNGQTTSSYYQKLVAYPDSVVLQRSRWNVIPPFHNSTQQYGFPLYSMISPSGTRNFPNSG